MNFINNFRHYLVLTTIGLISGLIFTYFSEPTFTFYSTIYLIILLFVLLTKLIFCLTSKKHFPRIMTLSILFIIPFILASFRICFWNNSTLKVLRTLENDNTVYTAKITSIPQEVSNGTFTADALVYKIKNNAKEKNVNMNVSIIFKKTIYENIDFGDSVKFYTKYRPEKNNSFINQKGKNQVATLNANQCIKIDNAKNPLTFSSFISYPGVIIRRLILSAIDSIYSYNSKSAAVVKAILTGDKNGFSDSLYDAFKYAGFLHVAAISGMHVSILFAFLSILLVNIRIGRKLTVLISAFFIIIFTSVASFTPSVLRAAIMLIISNFSIFANREYDSLTALFFSALIILIIFPYAIFTSGFLLSFGATLGIILFYKYISNAFRNIFGKLSSIFMLDSLSVSISAFLGTISLSLLFFGEISFWSLITNIWIVPLVCIVFCLGFISGILYYILPQAASILSFLNEPCIYIIIKTAGIFSQFKFAIISPNFTPWCFYLYYLSFLFIILYFFKSSKRL